MALLVGPDIEQIVGDYLRSHPDVRAVVGRVVSRPPADTRTPWVKYSQPVPSWGLSGPAHYLRGYLIQCDCYAGVDNSRETAALIGRTVSAALAAMAGTYGTAVVSGVPSVGDAHVPDPDFGDPPRERYIVSATIVARPA